MADEHEGKGGGAGAPDEPKTDAQVNAERIAEAIRKARANPAVGPKEKLIAEAMERSETEEMRRALGLDIPFDVKTLLTRGVIYKQGLQVGDQMYVDMHTLNKSEDILAERLVELHHGNMPLGKAYLEAKTVAILAMSITRINRDRFPAPSSDPADRGTEGWKVDWELKQALFRSLESMSSGDIDAMMLVYANLDKMDVLIDEAARKKSS